MNAKTFIWIGVFIGSTVGAYIPALWGAGVLSFSSIILSMVGGLAGIWAGFKLGQML
jgi:hypothetical protein